MGKFGKIFIGLIALALILVIAISGKYLDWLWFKSLGPTSVFWVSLLTGPLTKLCIGLVIFVFFMANFFLAARSFDRIRVVDSFWAHIPKSNINLIGLGVSAVLAFFVTSGLSIHWTVIQQYINQVSTGATDPLFNKDLGFYLFAFPFYQQLNILLSTTTFLAVLGMVVVYFLARAFWRQDRTWEIWLPAKIHLTILTIAFFAVKIWGYSLSKYNLLFQETARLTGVGYTADHATILAYNILTWIVVGIIGVLLVGIFIRGGKILVGGLALWLIASLALINLYPGAIQSFVVTPNEFEMEKPYLENHIKFTRLAYDLDRIKTEPFQPASEGKVRPISVKNPALTDLRLWDYKPLIPVYNQLQSIRPYYEFKDIDIDRYPSNQGQRQVMIAARELNTGKLSEQARTWINLHLTYTHGYGVAANQVSQFSPQGQPLFIARDLPPKADAKFPLLQVNQPGIYFGELTDQYIIVNSRSQEFDFPQGDDNISTTYEGPAGIKLNSFLTRALFAFRYQEPNFVLSSLLTSESSILLYRDIQTRVRKLAPFLAFDEDPYLVVSGGKLYWFLDAYTVSAYYPYAKSHHTGVKYIRNSVKVIMDAYNGNVDFYAVDTEDPILKVWRKVFPHLFKSMNTLSPDLVSHFRYPELLLSIQRDMLLQYHMVDPKTFYEKEDYWDVPVHNQDEPFKPYFVTLKLPGEKASEFVMMQPFSPRGKQNLISWLVARCDAPHYGELILYNLPKDQNIYGPAQIDSRINQNETISQLITLWNQQQSKVLWGNLLIIPMEDSLLYVKPLMIESERGQQAELKKIVMVYDNQVLIGDTVAEALSQTSLRTVVTTEEQESASPEDRKAEIMKRLDEIGRNELQLFNERQSLLKELRNF